MVPPYHSALPLTTRTSLRTRGRGGEGREDDELGDAEERSGMAWGRALARPLSEAGPGWGCSPNRHPARTIHHVHAPPRTNHKNQP